MIYTTEESMWLRYKLYKSSFCVDRFKELSQDDKIMNVGTRY